jgi:preprotein translocase subunit SecE
MAERKRRGEDIDDRLDDAIDDDSAVDEDLDDEFEDDEFEDDADEDEDDEDETPRRSANGRKSGTALKKKDDVDEDDDEERPASRRGPRGRAAKPSEKRPVKKKAGDKPGIFARFANFFREVVAELRKVIWPTRKELLTYTAVVVVFVTLMLTFVGGMDWLLAKGVLWVFGHGSTPAE